MVYFKRVVLASLFALGSLTAASQGEALSLKQIILEIPEENVRGRIEAAYMDGNFDEVEKDLFNYLDEYNFEDSEVEDVQGTKEKAWSIIRERIDEMRAASVNDVAFEEEAIPDGELPNPDEDEAGPDGPEGVEEGSPLERVRKFFAEKELRDVVNEMPEPEKSKLLDMIDNPESTYDSIKVEFDDYIENFIKNSPHQYSDDEVKVVEGIIHAIIRKHYDQKGVPGPSAHEEGERMDAALEKLSGMSLEELVNEMPEGNAKTKALEDMESGDATMTEAAIGNFLEGLDMSAELVSSARTIIHEKILDYFGADESVPQLMEDESDIVNVIRDIEMAQEKVMDLINELKGKH
mmetsp:Transcript_58361/g.69655  ORF Transcript_58361/g.69655 Transcript_58361/m.69655 type:complete len:350 (+) Transcript_58361:159-1208(+)